jgi:hypothetical protein
VKQLVTSLIQVLAINKLLRKPLGKLFNNSTLLSPNKDALPSFFWLIRLLRRLPRKNVIILSHYKEEKERLT